jgi:hypothetical protein
MLSRPPPQCYAILAKVDVLRILHAGSGRRRISIPATRHRAVDAIACQNRIAAGEEN